MDIDLQESALMFRHKHGRPTSVSDNGRYAVVAESLYRGVCLSVYRTDAIPYTPLYTCKTTSGGCGDVRVAVSCSGDWCVVGTLRSGNLRLVRYLYVDGSVTKQSTLLFTNIQDNNLNIGIYDNGSVWHDGVLTVDTSEATTVSLLCGFVVSTTVLAVSTGIGYITFTLGV